MTSLAVITPSLQQRWHQLYKIAPLVILMLYMRSVGDRPVTQIEISRNLKIARNTAANKLRLLVNLGAIYQLDHNSGYHLTHDGRQMLLALDEKPGCSKFEHPSLSFIKESLTKDSKDKDLKDMKERKKEMLKYLTKDQILEETGKLFPGHAITTFGLHDDLEPEYILAWLAQAYDQHQQGKIGYPWALVYKRLKANSSLPDKKYQVDPLVFLPNAFLVALDLADPIVVEAQAVAIPKNITTIREFTGTVESAIFDAWLAVKDHLRENMSRAAFDTWVEGTYPVGYENDLVCIATRNRYAADWLTDRMQAEAESLLRGILDQTIQVEFVVVMED